MTGAITDPFGESAMIRRYLAVEGALAEVQGELGLIPTDAASAIADWCATASIDRAAYERDLAEHGFPLVGLVRQIVAGVPGVLGEWAHFGATTQDIMDTAAALAARDALDHIDALLGELIDALATLAAAHADTPAIGRSQLQHAIPITFGFRVATWADPLPRHRERLRRVRDTELVVQMSGAMGTSAAMHPHGPRVAAALATRLELGAPVIGWHSARDRFVAYVQALASTCASIGKLATDVLLLSQGDAGEVAEPGRATSSTMPNKRNPVLSQSILLETRRARDAAGAMLEAALVHHERGAARWQIEWDALPEATAATCAALRTARQLIDGLEVASARMRENLERAGDGVHAEALMMALAPGLGRQAAHDAVADAVADAAARRVTLADAVLASPEIGDHLDRKRLAAATSGEVEHAAAAAATRTLIDHLRSTSQ